MAPPPPHTRAAGRVRAGWVVSARCTRRGLDPIKQLSVLRRLGETRAEGSGAGEREWREAARVREWRGAARVREWREAAR
eukprot:7390614-Prymnesium_polylepis.2